MTEATPFLLDRLDLTRSDLAQLHIIAKGGRRDLRAKVERIYLSRKEISGDFLKPGAEIDFWAYSGGFGVRDGMWPEVGDRALISLRGPSGDLSQSSEHVLCEDIDDEPYGIYRHSKLWKYEGDESIPFLIRTNARPDTKRSYMVAIRFEAIEADIQASIEAISHGHIARTWSEKVDKIDVEFMQDGCVLQYDLTSPTVASDIMASLYHRARTDEIVPQRHATLMERLHSLGGPFGLESVGPPSALVFTDGGYWRGERQDGTNAVAMNGWYAFRGVRPLEDKAADDDAFHYKFNACDTRLDYKKLIHDDFKRAITALDAYRAVWRYSRYGLAYQRGFLEETEDCDDENGWPIDFNKQYTELCRDKSLDVDGRNNIYTLYPAQYWDAELCQRALGHGPDEVIRRLQDKAPRAERLGDGVYLVLNDDPELRYDDFLALNNRYKPLLGLK